MKKPLLIFLLAVATSLCAGAQRMDSKALRSFSPSTQRQVYELCQFVSLDSPQQQQLAKAIEKENAEFVRLAAKNEGYINTADRRRLQQMRDKALATVMSPEQLWQYYRGVFGPEGNAEGKRVADELVRKYSLSDQNWKFVRNALQIIAIDSRVIKKIHASEPKKAAAMVAKLKADQLADVERRGGLRVDPDEMTVVFTREFNPTALRME